MQLVPQNMIIKMYSDFSQANTLFNKFFFITSWSPLCIFHYTLLFFRKRPPRHGSWAESAFVKTNSKYKGDNSLYSLYITVARVPRQSCEHRGFTKSLKPDMINRSLAWALLFKLLLICVLPSWSSTILLMTWSHIFINSSLFLFSNQSILISLDKLF